MMLSNLYRLSIVAYDYNKLKFILKKFKDLNLEVLGHSVTILKDRVKASVIINFRDSKARLHELLNKFIPVYAEKISFFEIPYETPYPKCYPLELHGMRVIMMGKPVLKAIIEGIKERFGREVGSSILWYLGYHAGYGVCREFMKVYKFKDMEDYFSMLKLRGVILGWFIIDNFEIRLDGEEAINILIRLRENWECSLAENEEKPYSQFIRGVLSGFTSCILGREVVAIERKCRAKGDLYCEFIIEVK